MLNDVAEYLRGLGIWENTYVIMSAKLVAFWFAMELITLLVLVGMTVLIPEFRKDTVVKSIKQEGLDFSLAAVFLAINLWPIVYYAIYCAWRDQAPWWGEPRTIYERHD